jgi:AraC-like DNA-binding protein
MIYEEIPPGPAAARFVDSYWRFRLAEGATGPVKHIIPPDGMTSLSIGVHPRGVSPLLVAGPSRRAHVTDVHPELIYAGVRLRPEAAGPIIGVTGGALRGLFGPLQPPLSAPAFLPEAIAGFARTRDHVALDAGFEAFDGMALDPGVAQVAAVLVASGGRGAVRDLAAAAGLSERQLRRRFFDVAGMAPKEFAGVRRLREACIVAVAEQRSWAEAAAAANYADQAHLSREVKDAFAQTPRRIAQYLRLIDHRFG